jgi:uncharacterized protein YkwD
MRIPSRPLTALSLLLFALLAGASMAGSAQAQGTGPETSMLERINAIRAEQGLTPLVRDGRLDAAARVHTEEMATRGELMHVSDTTGTPIDRARAAGIDASDIAENVAMHHTVEEAQASLEGSAAHLTNMLGARATHVGLAAISAASGIYVTQIFGHLDVPAAPAVAPTPAPTESGSVIAVDVPVTAPVAPPAPAAPVEAARVPVAGGGTAIVVPPDPSGVVRVPAPAPGVSGYWICAADPRGGRWYYYPVRPGVSGPVAADLSVTGSPPGYGTTCTTSASAPPPAASPSTGRVLITPWGSVRVETRRR